jgi:hypothetical protein
MLDPSASLVAYAVALQPVHERFEAGERAASSFLPPEEPQSTPVHRLGVLGQSSPLPFRTRAIGRGGPSRAAVFPIAITSKLDVFGHSDGAHTLLPADIFSSTVRLGALTDVLFRVMLDETASPDP